jgi:hypothetical protein
MRRYYLLVASAAAVLFGAVGVVVVARMAPEVAPYLVAPGTKGSVWLLAIDRIALGSLLLGLPLVTSAIGALSAPSRTRKAVVAASFCAGLVVSCLVLLGVVGGTFSTAEAYPIDTSAAEALGATSELIVIGALFIGLSASIVAVLRNRHRAATTAS